MLGALVRVLTGVLALVLAAGPVQGGLAGWTASAQRTSAPLSVAVVGGTFVPRSAGTGGTTYTTGSLLGGAATFDLVSTSSVPVVFTGTVTTASLLLPTNVLLTSCTVPWQDLVCAGTSRVVLPTTAITAPLGVTWTAPGAAVNPQGALYLRIAVTGSVLNSVILSATPVPARPPGDRTAA